MLVAAQNLSAQSVPERRGEPAPSGHATPRASQAIAPAPLPAPAPAPTPPSAPAPSPFAATPSTYAPHYGPASPARSRMFQGLSPFLFGYGYGVSYPYDSPAPGGEQREISSGRQDATGSLDLDVEPGTARVYVDGFYIGTVDDLRRTGVMLPAGRHSIELRASGYETLTIPVNIDAGRPTRYHGDLTAERRPVAEAGFTPRDPGVTPARPASSTIFVIPGCYAGDRPPRESALPPGCDIARVHVLTSPR